MENAFAFDIEYREHIRQTAWVNENDWQFAKPARRHPVRQAVAKGLIALAQALTPATKPDTQAA